MYPWRDIWFQPKKTAAWVKSSQPLYGVVLIIVLYLLVSIITRLVGPGIGLSAEGLVEDSATVSSGVQKVALLIDTWIMPVIMLFLLYLVGRYLSGQASVKNVLWVMVWSQLPIILLSVIALALQFAGIDTTAPLLNNKIPSDINEWLINPPEPDINKHGLLYFTVSSVLALWSFQILLSGTAAVQGMTVHRAIWVVTFAMLILMLLRIPITIVLGDIGIVDLLGLQGIIDLE